MSPNNGDIVVVKGSDRTRGNGLVYVQKYHHSHNGKYYCYRDDGVEGLIEWDEMRPNTFKWKYHEKSK